MAEVIFTTIVTDNPHTLVVPDREGSPPMYWPASFPFSDKRKPRWPMAPYSVAWR